jgi:hypothetical protein
MKGGQMSHRNRSNSFIPLMRVPPQILKQILNYAQENFVELEIALNIRVIGEDGINCIKEPLLGFSAYNWLFWDGKHTYLIDQTRRNQEKEFRKRREEQGND